ncbi:MAG TPA: FIST N-terminal domain-containing protein [Bacteriovoracaceae bacterium]|nr:FIST N-terminal domain-containing protein [Bacteriovoracaceae bacterium]
MTESTVAYCDLTNSNEAGIALGEQINKEMNGNSPDIVIVFASSKYNYKELLQSIKNSCKAKLIMGCSSAGEFVGGKKGEGAVSVLAIRSSSMHFNVCLGKDLRVDRTSAAKELTNSLVGKTKPSFKYRTILLLADALAGHTDELIQQLTTLTAGTYQFFGGGAGDDAKFSSTHVFFGTEAITDAVVGLEILSHSPLGIGVKHGWAPSSKIMRVTEADGMKLVSLNSIPAAEVFEEHAEATGQKFDLANPMPFFLHNALGIQTEGGYKLRVPLSVQPDGSLMCASNIPVGASVCIMKTTSNSSIEAAKIAVESALEQLQGRKPKAALFFDCVASRLRMGGDFGLELATLEKSLGENTQIAGCNSYGQIARVEGQFSGFHNCTAVVCIIPD